MCKVSIPLTWQSTKHPELYAPQSIRKIPDLYVIEGGSSLSAIAIILCRYRSTIYREISRNSGLRSYRPKQADRLSNQRAERSRNVPQIPSDIWQSVAKLLNIELSPEQISALSALQI